MRVHQMLSRDSHLMSTAFIKQFTELGIVYYSGFSEIIKSVTDAEMLSGADRQCLNPILSDATGVKPCTSLQANPTL
jgi:hypothetical protein